MKIKERALAIWKDPVWSKVISVGILGVIAAVYSLVTTQGRKWLFESIYLDRIQVVGWFLLGLGIGIGVVWWVVRRKRPRTSKPAFVPIPVHDKKLGLEWRIMIDPKGWADDHKIKGSAAGYQSSVLAGPYHLKADCGADMALLLDRGSQSAQVSSICPSCGDRTFQPDRFNALLLRELTITELQRMHRNGKKLSGTVVLEKPEYWQYLCSAFEE